MPNDPDTPAPHTTASSLLSEFSDTQLRLEREKLVLERERLALERERMESEREQWRAEREMLGQASSGLHVGMGVFGLAVAVALVVAGLVGFNAGLETGRNQAPAPRYVLVGRKFQELLARTQRLPPPSDPTAGPADGFDGLALYRRPPQARAFGNLPILR